MDIQRLAHMLSAGYNFFRSKLDDDFDFYAESNRFVYREMVNSAYASWRASWSGAFSTSAGLRVENTRTDGHLIDTDGERTKRNYTDLSPIHKPQCGPAPGNQNISLDFVPSISRPWYQKLNPFIRWTSDNTYTKGQSLRKTAYSWFWSLYYSFLRDFVLNARYYIHRPAFDYQYSDGSGNTVSSTTNQSSEHVWDIKLQYSKTFWGKYNLRVRTGVEHIKSMRP